MNRRSKSFIWLGLALISLLFSVQARKINENEQLDKKLILKSHNSNSISPELNLAISMGVFRSVIIDFLWMRAIKLQQEKRFYEIVQLYDMIGKLQPYNSKVWAYSAWNMAFNISVEHPVGIERWRWVQNGIDRLKNHGLKYNPNNGLLYKELAWIYSFKIARHMDDSHVFYKTKLAEKMTKVFEPFKANANTVLSKLSSTIESEKEKAEAVEKRLEDILGMDLKEMVDLENNPDFGPLDWRMGEAHAIYWSMRGIKKRAYGVYPGDLNRLCYQAMQHLLRHGTLVYLEENNESPARVLLWPDYRQVDPINRMFVKQIKYFSTNKLSTDGPRSAYHYFLKEALEILVHAGQDKLAEDLFESANELIPNILSGYNAKDHIEQDLDKRIKEMNGLQFNGLISSLLMQHFWWKGYGDIKRSNAMWTMANKMWLKNITKNKNKNRRITQSLEDILRSVLLTIVKKKMFHPDILQQLQADPGVQEILKTTKGKV
jgi:hypothetical protein